MFTQCQQHCDDTLRSSDFASEHHDNLDQAKPNDSTSYDSEKEHDALHGTISHHRKRESFTRIIVTDYEENNKQQPVFELRPPTPIYSDGPPSNKCIFNDPTLQREKENFSAQIFKETDRVEILKSPNLSNFFSNHDSAERFNETWKNYQLNKTLLDDASLNFSNSFDPALLPHPTNLRILRRLTQTLIIEWQAPINIESELIECYHVIVDGCLATITSNTSCVVERIYDDKEKYIISVCCITTQGRSDPGFCVVTYMTKPEKPSIGKLSIEYLTQDSARVAWKPYHSEANHVISVVGVHDHETSPFNSHSLIEVSAPFYCQTIRRLEPAVVYEIVIMSPTNEHVNEFHSSSVRFRTLHVSPPSTPILLGVKVEPPLFLTVTWITDKADGKKEEQPRGKIKYEFFVNKSLLSIVNWTSESFWKVPLKTFAKRLSWILKRDSSFLHPVFKDFSHGFPPVFITMRALSNNRSDFSNAILFSKHLVRNFMRLTEAKGENKKEEICKFVENKLSSDEESSEFNKKYFRARDELWNRIDTEEFREIRKLHNDASCLRRSRETSSDEEMQKVQWRRKDFYWGTSNCNHKKCRSQIPYIHSRSKKSKEKFQTCSNRIKDKYEEISSGSESDFTSRIRQQACLHLPMRPPTSSSIHSNPKTYRCSPFQKETTNEDYQIMNRCNLSTLYHSRRIFFLRALYNYSPATMSPNSHFHEEISFQKGEILKAYGGMDRDRFYFGENRNGFKGFIPSNMVTLTHRSEYLQLKQAFERGRSYDQFSHTSNMQAASLQTTEENQSNFRNFTTAHCDEMKLYQSLRDYTPVQTSSDVEELCFCKGDIIRIFGDVDEDGFYWGEIDGRFGYVPSNFVQLKTDLKTPKNDKLNNFNPAITVTTMTMTDSSFLSEAQKQCEDIKTAVARLNLPSSKTKHKPGFFKRSQQFIRKFRRTKK